MIVAGSASPLLLSSAGGYNLTKSLRFRASASAYLNRTPASAGNSQTWTWSAWVKPSLLNPSSVGLIEAATNSNNRAVILFPTTQALQVFFSSGGSTVCNLVTTAVYRDPSSWYHFLVAVDTTQATDSNRVKMYVNGTQVTSFSTSTYPTQNFNTQFNTTVANVIGAGAAYSPTAFFDGYMTEINFIDGQALTPSSFGQTSPTTGVWQPRRYTGTYGTNGFYLPFTNTTSTATLGNDFSGNNNTWTVNNISLTSGTTYDSMNDVPTLTNATTANYCVWNPLSNGAGTLSNANLQLGGIGGAGLGRCNGTVAVSSGKWYFESTLTTASSYTNIGIGQGDITNQYPGQDAVSYAFTCEQAIKINNNNQPSYGVSLTTGDVLMVAFDLDNNKIFFGKNGTWMASSDPVTGANPAFTIAAGTYKPIARPYDSSGVINVNFGQRPFAYTPPTGFVALNTFNLSTPTIGATASTQADDYFNAVLYSGNNSTQTITTGFQPDFIWSKCRNSARSHRLVDSVRGVSYQLFSDTTDGGNTYDATSYVSSITSTSSSGFSITNAGTDQYNTSGENYVSWAWNAGGSTVTNTSGSITSQVRANTTAGFSVVTYTGNGTTSTVGHGLGVAPSMIIVKRRNAGSSGWSVYFTTLAAGNVLSLQSTNAASSSPNRFTTTLPTSTVFSIGTDSDLNASGGTYVAYCFAQVAGYSAFGSYTGNGSTDGPFIYTGFRPRFILTKASSFSTASTVWTIWDTSRSPYNAAVLELYPNSFSSESTDSSGIDILSNGFKPRRNSEYANSNGQTYIYMAIAESPFKFALAR